MKTRTLKLAGLSFLLLWAVAATAAPGQKEHGLKVGKKGEITLTQQTKVGDTVLQPDTYVVQHRTSGGDHFVRFVELKQVESQPSTELPYTYTEQDKVGEIKCNPQPATGPINETTVYTVIENGMQRITKVEIKGEDVVHVL
jgi:hypothetical protein